MPTDAATTSSGPGEGRPRAVRATAPQSAASHQRHARGTCVVLAYLLSVGGLALAPMVVFDSTVAGRPLPADSLALVLLLGVGWLLHFTLTGFWIADRRLPRAWAVAGATVWLGTLLLPFALQIGGLWGPRARWADLPLDFFWTLVLDLALVGSSVVLGVRLLRFHWRRS